MSKETIERSLRGESGDLDEVNLFVIEMTNELSREFDDFVFQDKQFRGDVLKDEPIFVVYTPFREYLKRGFLGIEIMVDESHVRVNPNVILDVDEELSLIGATHTFNHNESFASSVMRLKKFVALRNSLLSIDDSIEQGDLKAATTDYKKVSRSLQEITGIHPFNLGLSGALLNCVSRKDKESFACHILESIAIINPLVNKTHKKCRCIEEDLSNILFSTAKTMHESVLERASNAINRARVKFDMKNVSPFIMDEYLDQRLGKGRKLLSDEIVNSKKCSR